MEHVLRILSVKNENITDIQIASKLRSFARDTPLNVDSAQAQRQQCGWLKVDFQQDWGLPARTRSIDLMSERNKRNTCTYSEQCGQGRVSSRLPTLCAVTLARLLCVHVLPIPFFSSSLFLLSRGGIPRTNLARFPLPVRCVDMQR